MGSPPEVLQRVLGWPWRLPPVTRSSSNRRRPSGILTSCPAQLWSPPQSDTKPAWQAVSFIIVLTPLSWISRPLFPSPGWTLRGCSSFKLRYADCFSALLWLWSDKIRRTKLSANSRVATMLSLNHLFITSEMSHKMQYKTHALY